MKIQISESGTMMVYLKTPTWDEAAKLISFNREDPPLGYKLVQAIVQTRGKSGQSANLTLQFVHCDNRVDPLTEEDAYELFRTETPEG